MPVVVLQSRRLEQRIDAEPCEDLTNDYATRWTMAGGKGSPDPSLRLLQATLQGGQLLTLYRQDCLTLEV